MVKWKFPYFFLVFCCLSHCFSNFESIKIWKYHFFVVVFVHQQSVQVLNTILLFVCRRLNWSPNLLLKNFHMYWKRCVYLSLVITRKLCSNKLFSVRVLFVTVCKLKVENNMQGKFNTRKVVNNVVRYLMREWKHLLQWNVGSIWSHTLFCSLWQSLWSKSQFTIPSCVPFLVVFLATGKEVKAFCFIGTKGLFGQHTTFSLWFFYRGKKLSFVQIFLIFITVFDMY